MHEPAQTQDNEDGDQASADTPDKHRNPRAPRKTMDMPEDHDEHQTDPEEDYEKPDGTGPRRGLGGS